MKSLLAIAVLALAGCATYDNDQYAKADCKVAPITTQSATGVRPSRVDSLAQRDAEMQLATTDYYRRNLAQKGLVNNNTADALRDCY